MTRYRHYLLMVAACATLFCFTNEAEAQSWPPLLQPSSVEKSTTEDVAVLVGIEDYAFLPDVEGAGSNLVEWERFLRQDLGLKKVLVLRDENATREEILAMADRAVGETSGAGKLWFVFIGHGAPSVTSGEPLIVGVDGQRTPNSIATRGVSQKELMERLEAGEQHETIALFDACFSGRTPDGDELVEGVQPVMPTATFEAPGRTTLMTASSGDQVAGRLPGTSRPAFSYLVLGGLRGWADDGDGVVTASEAVEFARVELLGVPGRKQTPQLVGDADTALTIGASEARPTVLSAGSTGALVSSSTPSESTDPAASAASGSPSASDGQVADSTSTSDELAVEQTGEFNFPFMARLSAGTSGVPQAPAESFGVELGAGYKFDGPSAYEWRVISSVRMSGFHPHRAGDEVQVEYDGAEALVRLEETDSPVRSDELLLAATLGPGFAWRDGIKNGLPTHLVSMDVFALGGLLPNYCRDESFYQPTELGAERDIRCRSGDYYTMGVGARVGYTWKFLDAGFSVLYTFATDDLIFTSTVGFAIDP